MRNVCLSVILFLAGALMARGQFYNVGTDPGHLKWYSIETPYYQVIYPSGTDSLARNYAQLLERFRIPSGNSIGLMPGSLQWRKLPVVLHPYNGYANGSVPWAPSRMDLYTVTPVYGDPSPWEIQILSHEPRHQAQWQLGYSGFLKPFGYIFGEASSGVAFGLYMDISLAEGDAVAAETGFGYGTRARTVDFLDYYRMALDQGDFRSWERWRYGSYKHATPDYYTLGYITVGGVRYFYDYPLFTADFLKRSLKRPFHFTLRNMRETASERSGKPFKETFSEILHKLDDQWQKEAEARAPFLPQEQVTRSARGYPVSYNLLTSVGDVLYTLRKHSARGYELLSYRNGKEDILMPMSSSVSGLYPDKNYQRIYWAETVADIRWELSHRSIIRYYDIPRKKVVDLTHSGRLRIPQPSPDGLMVAALELPYEGGNNLLVLSALDGAVLRKIRVPDGLQAVDMAWWGDSFYVLGVSAAGTGLYLARPDGAWETVLEPTIQKVFSMTLNGDSITWISDRDGSNEYYRFFPESGRLEQVTSARYGLLEPNAMEDGYLYFLSHTLDGLMIFRTPLEALQPKEVSFADVHSYPMEDALVAQERALGPLPEGGAELSEPKRYYKLPHLLRLHSWLPFYVNYDAVEGQSLDFSFKTASLGLTGFFQNTLGTMSGYLGYSAHPDTEKDGPWMHSLHGKLTYTGWYPVIEASFDLGGDWARQYYLNQYSSVDRISMNAQSFLRNDPLYSVRLSTWLPLRFNKGGMLAGFIPKLNYSLTNGGFATNAVLWNLPEHFFSGLPTFYRFTGYGEGKNIAMHRLSGSLRGYWMLPTAENGVYPRLGIGLEAGMSLRPGLANIFTPNLFCYGYAYLPGIWLPQGLRVTGLYQQQLKSEKLQFGEMYADIMPRGFEPAAGARVAQSSTWQYRVTADYAIPIYVGDLSLGFFTYIKNFLLTPHFDYTGFQGGNLWSAGADLTAKLAHLLRLPFGGSVGVSFSYLGGSWYSQVAEGKPFSVSMIFGFDL